MASSSPRRVLIVCGQLGFVLAATQLPMSLSLGVVFDQQQMVVRSLLLLLFPVTYACFGLGAALAPRSGAMARPGIGLRLGGGALLGLQVALLALPLLTAGGWALQASVAVVGVLLGGWYFALGLVLSRLLAELRVERPDLIGVAWAVHLAGIVAGYLLSVALVPAVGVHALLVAVGLSALPGGVGGPVVLVLALSLARPVGLDAHLEALRQAPVPDRLTCTPVDPEKPVSWSGWSHHAYVQIVHVSGREDAIAGYYNRHCYWSMIQQGILELDRFRRALYRSLNPDGPVVVVGVGGGRGLRAFDTLSPRITAVEQDGAVVRVLRDEHPEWAGGLLARVNTLAADGRSVVERQRSPLAGVIIEGAVFQPSQAMIPASRILWLYTADAVRAYLDSLRDDGLLLVNFNRVDIKGTSDGYLLAQVVETLRELDVPHQVLRSVHGHIYLAACPSVGCLDQYKGAWSDLPVEDVTARVQVAEGDYRLTDGDPFVGWAVLKPTARAMLTAVAGAMTGMALLPLVLWRRQGDGWDPVPAGAALGLAHGTVVLAVAHFFRSYHGDSVLTVLRVYVAFAAFGGVGGLLAGRLPGWLISRRALVPGTVLAGLALWVGLQALPFGPVEPWLREFAAAMAIGPFAIWTGLLLPLSLARTGSAQVGQLLLADALGTLAAAGVLYLVALPLGLNAWLWVGLVVYGVAAFWIGSKETKPALAGAGQGRSGP